MSTSGTVFAGSTVVPPNNVTKVCDGKEDHLHSAGIGKVVTDHTQQADPNHVLNNLNAATMTNGSSESSSLAETRSKRPLEALEDASEKNPSKVLRLGVGDAESSGNGHADGETGVSNGLQEHASEPSEHLDSSGSVTLASSADETAENGESTDTKKTVGVTSTDMDVDSPSLNKAASVSSTDLAAESSESSLSSDSLSSSSVLPDSSVTVTSSSTDVKPVSPIKDRNIFTSIGDKIRGSFKNLLKGIDSDHASGLTGKCKSPTKNCVMSMAGDSSLNADVGISGPKTLLTSPSRSHLDKGNLFDKLSDLKPGGTFSTTCTSTGDIKADKAPKVKAVCASGASSKGDQDTLSELTEEAERLIMEGAEGEADLSDVDESILDQDSIDDGKPGSSKPESMPTSKVSQPKLEPDKEPSLIHPDSPSVENTPQACKKTDVECEAAEDDSLKFSCESAGDVNVVAQPDPLPKESDKIHELSRSVSDTPDSDVGNSELCNQTADDHKISAAEVPEDSDGTVEDHSVDEKSKEIQISDGTIEKEAAVKTDEVQKGDAETAQSVDEKTITDEVIDKTISEVSEKTTECDIDTGKAVASLKVVEESAENHMADVETVETVAVDEKSTEDQRNNDKTVEVLGVVEKTVEDLQVCDETVEKHTKASDDTVEQCSANQSSEPMDTCEPEKPVDPSNESVIKDDLTEQSQTVDEQTSIEDDQGYVTPETGMLEKTSTTVSDSMESAESGPDHSEDKDADESSDKVEEESCKPEGKEKKTESEQVEGKLIIEPDATSEPKMADGDVAMDVDTVDSSDTAENEQRAETSKADDASENKTSEEQCKMEEDSDVKQVDAKQECKLEDSVAVKEKIEEAEPVTEEVKTITCTTKSEVKVENETLPTTKVEQVIKKEIVEDDQQNIIPEEASAKEDPVVKSEPEDAQPSPVKLEVQSEIENVTNNIIDNSRKRSPPPASPSAKARVKRSRLDAVIGRLGTQACAKSQENCRSEGAVLSSSDSGSECDDSSRVIRISAKKLNRLIEKRMAHYMESTHGQLVSQLHTTIEELQASRDAWRSTAKELHKQVVEATILAQRSERRRSSTSKIQAAMTGVSQSPNKTSPQKVVASSASVSTPSRPVLPASQPMFVAAPSIANNTSAVKTITLLTPSNMPPISSTPVAANAQQVQYRVLPPRVDTKPATVTAVTSSAAALASPTIASRLAASQAPTVRELLDHQRGPVQGAKTPTKGIIDLTDEEEKSPAKQPLIMRGAPGRQQVALVQAAGGGTQTVTLGPQGINPANLRPGQTLLLQSSPTSSTMVLQPMVTQAIRSQGATYVYTTAPAAPARPGIMVPATGAAPGTVVRPPGTLVRHVLASAPQVRGPTQLSAAPRPTAMMRPATGPQPVVSVGHLPRLLALPRVPTAQLGPRLSGNMVIATPMQPHPAVIDVDAVSWPPVAKHPAPLPPQPAQKTGATMRALPPKPGLKISRVQQGIVLSWNMTVSDTHATIVNYQLFAYQEGSAAPNSSLWKKVGDVKALPLPMACTLTQFQEGNKYHFAVRAVDTHHRVGPFSDPNTIHLVGKAGS